MDNTKTVKKGSLRPTTRRLIQLYSALLHNAHLKGFISGEIYQGNAKYACVPGFNCYSCPGAIGACPLGSLQGTLASMGHRAGWYVFGILMLFGVTLGRTICGWICPLGLIQELLHKIPTFKIKKSRVTRILSYLKYFFLGYFAIAIPLWYGLREGIPMPGFCKYICPAGTLEGAIGLLSNNNNNNLFNMLGIFFTRKFIILMAIGLACTFMYRSFCRFVCPLGAIYGLFNRFCLVGVRVDADRCNGCGACVRHCKMDVKQVGDHECIHCAGCMEVCHQNAISLKAGKLVLKGPEITPKNGEPAVNAAAPAKNSGKKWAVRIAALAVLCFALVWFNFLDPAVRLEASTKEETAAASTQETGTAEGVDGEFSSSAKIGFEIGDQLKDFTIECLDGTEFHLADTRGKITFINLWGTYCVPCVNELPYFNDMYLAHQDDVVVLAVHGFAQPKPTPKDFLADKDWVIKFAVDNKENEVFKIVNGSATLPQTIVLNRRGEVIYNQDGPVTPEALNALYEKALADDKT